MFKYSLDNKRYHTLNYFYRNKFNNKVFKVPIDAHLDCPNKKNGKGCIYCSDNSKANIINSADDIVKQFQDNIKVLEKKWPNSYYIPYFQAGTNTNAPLKKLKELFEKLLDYPKVVGLAIATRPDTLNNEVLDYLSKLNEKTFLTVEIGLQSSNDETLRFINRGHDVNSFVNGVKELKNRKIFTVAHIINGLPNDTEEDMLNTARLLNNLKVDGIKIHMLYISKNTTLSDIYEKQKFHILSKEEYIDIVIKQLEILDEKIELKE